LSDNFKQELYHKCLKLSLSKGKVDSLNESIKLLKVVNIKDHDVLSAMKSGYNNIVQYLLENKFSSKYNEIAQIAAENGNYEMINWLFDRYDKQFDFDKIKKIATDKNKYKKIAKLCNEILFAN
jgi:hypothetical protein